MRESGPGTRDKDGAECLILMAASMRWYKNQSINSVSAAPAAPTNIYLEIQLFSSQHFLPKYDCMIKHFRVSGCPGWGRARVSSSTPAATFTRASGGGTRGTAGGATPTPPRDTSRRDGGTLISSNALSVQRSMLTHQQLAFLLSVLKIIKLCWRNKNPKYLTNKRNKRHDKC